MRSLIYVLAMLVLFVGCGKKVDNFCYENGQAIVEELQIYDATRGTSVARDVNRLFAECSISNREVKESSNQCSITEVLTLLDRPEGESYYYKVITDCSDDRFIEEISKVYGQYIR